MPSLRERVDLASITVTLLPLPKGKKRGSGVGFCGQEPVALVKGAAAAPPYRWVNGKPEILTYQDVKKIGASGTSRSQIAGLWYTPKHDERALVWTRDAAGEMTGVELHPAKWQKSNALACSDTQQVGYGYEKFAEDPCRALLWEGSRESLVVLTGPDPAVETYGKGVADGIQVGYVGGARQRHGCLWRGTTESHIDLHPPSDRLVGSDILGAGDGQQVGHVWDEEMANGAALWDGSPESFVSLAPAGFVRSTAWACARGFQVGWAGKDDRGMQVRAILWSGSADDFLDLQEFLPAPWNVSQALALLVDGNRLRILGTAQQAVKSGGYEMNAGEVPVIWEIDRAVTADTFRQWLCLDFTPDPDAGAGVDYCLRLWLIIVEIDGVMKVGHLEPETDPQITLQLEEETQGSSPSPSATLCELSLATAEEQVVDPAILPRSRDESAC